MKKIISVIVCLVLTVSLSCTAFAGGNSSKSNPLSSLGDLIGGILGSVSDSSGDLLESLSDVAGNLSDILADAAEQAGDTLSDIADGAGEVLSDAAEGLQEVLPEAASGIQDALSGAGEDLGSSLSDVLGGLTDLIGGLTDTLNQNGIKVEISDDLDDIFEELNNMDLDDIDLDDLYDYYNNYGFDDDDFDEDFDDDLYDFDDDLDDDDFDDDDNFSGRPAKIPGGWSVNGEAASTLTDEEAAIFESAIQGLLGVSYTPVAVLATQLVAGTNYAFLCSGVTVIPNATPEWYVVTVYQDLKGNTAVISIEDIELDDIDTLDNLDTAAKVGAWKVAEPEEPAELPEKAQAAFEKASANWVGVGFSPIALLGTQIVAGTNYKVLCYGTTVTKDPVTSLYVIDIYEDLNGEAKITDAELFDLTEYIDN